MWRDRHFGPGGRSSDVLSVWGRRIERQTNLSYQKIQTTGLARADGIYTSTCLYKPPINRLSKRNCVTKTIRKLYIQFCVGQYKHTRSFMILRFDVSYTFEEGVLASGKFLIWIFHGKHQLLTSLAGEKRRLKILLRSQAKETNILLCSDNN